MHKPSKLMSIVECYQACHAFVTRASEIVDILNAMNHRASKCQMMAAPTLVIEIIQKHPVTHLHIFNLLF